MKRSLFLFISMVFVYSKFIYAHDCVFDKTPININAGLTYVDPNIAPGNKIGDVITGNMITILNCNNTSDIKNQGVMVISLGKSENGTLQYDGRIIYDTGIPGVGYAMGGYSPTCGKTSWAIVSSGTSANYICHNSSGPLGNTVLVQPMIQLYRTSTATPTGSMPLKLVGEYSIYTLTSSQNYQDTYVYMSATGKNLTCSVMTPNINVSMGKIKIADFSGPLTSDGTVKDFNIGLKCTDNTPVTVQLDGSNPLNSRLGILDIAKVTNKATGVGLQILDSTGINPVFLGKTISAGTLSGAISLPYKARYLQTDDTIEPGIANATATFTITYK